MKKISLLIIITLTSLLAGCTELKERIITLLTDNELEEIHLTDDTLVGQTGGIIDTAVKEVVTYLPSIKGDKTFSNIPRNLIAVYNPYAIDGDTLSGTVSKQQLTAHGIKITDKMNIEGDKVTVTVRYLLIDTPESVHPEKKKAQLYSIEAKNRNSALLSKGNVTISFENGHKIDKYGRLLAYVFYGDGTLLQETLVREGYARVAYVYEKNAKYLNLLNKAESAAKKDKINIWSIEGYVTENGFSD